MKFNAAGLARLVLGACYFLLGLAEPISAPLYSSKIRQTRARDINISDPSLVDPTKAVTLEPTRVVKRGRIWTSDEDELLLKLRGEGRPWAEIDEFFPERSWNGLSARYHRLIRDPSTVRNGKPESWTKKETKLLLELVDLGLSWKEIAKHFPTRSVGALRSHYWVLVQGHQPSRTVSNAYTADEDNVILEGLSSGKTLEEIAQSLERDRLSVRKRMKKLERLHGLDPALQTVAGRSYSDADLELIRRERDSNVSWKDIAAKHFPGRSIKSLKAFYRRATAKG